MFCFFLLPFEVNKDEYIIVLYCGTVESESDDDVEPDDEHPHNSNSDDDDDDNDDDSSRPISDCVAHSSSG